MKIFLLEDEKMLQTSIVEYLETLGHHCFAMSDGQKGCEHLEKECYDLLILDINVPTLNGLDLLEKLNQGRCNTPAIFISALVDIEKISEAFKLGAADYIKKPFHLKELALRVEKVANELTRAKKEHIVLSQNYSYIKKESKLLFQGKEQILTKKQHLIIECFCQNIGTVISFDIFREYAWQNSFVSDATIRTELSRLRKTLYEDFIQNYKGIGYKVDRYVIPPR